MQNYKTTPNTKTSLGAYWISPVVTFWSTFSLYKYVQGKSSLPENAPNRQIFKIKMDESEYRTQGTSLRQG